MIYYSYDAAGNKVQEFNETTPFKYTDYIGNFVYENNHLQYIKTPTGRTVWDANGNIKEDFCERSFG